MKYNYPFDTIHNEEVDICICEDCFYRAKKEIDELLAKTKKENENDIQTL